MQQYVAAGDPVISFVQQEGGCIDDVELGMRIRIERRQVRRVWITVHPNGQIVVVASWRYGVAQLWNIVRRHREWIERQRQRFRKMERIIVPAGYMLYRGELYRFVLRRQLGSTVLIYPYQRIIASGENLLNATIQQEWYINEAERLLRRRTRQLAERYGFKYRSISVRDYAGAWGYCSSSGDLFFDWRIAKVPPFVMDYLIVHELVHTKILGHNARFWRHVMKLCPDYRRAIEWLREQGRWV